MCFKAFCFWMSILSCCYHLLEHGFEFVKIRLVGEPWMKWMMYWSKLHIETLHLSVQRKDSKSQCLNRMFIHDIHVLADLEGTHRVPLFVHLENHGFFWVKTRRSWLDQAQNPSPPSWKDMFDQGSFDTKMYEVRILDMFNFQRMTGKYICMINGTILSHFFMVTSIGYDSMS